MTSIRFCRSCDDPFDKAILRRRLGCRQYVNAIDATKPPSENLDCPLEPSEEDQPLGSALRDSWQKT